MPTERVQLRFTGGPHSGLVVEAPDDVASQLPDMAFSAMASGQLFDLRAQSRIRGARVVRRPGEAAPVRAAPPLARVDPELARPPFAPPPPTLTRSATTVAPQFLPARG